MFVALCGRRARRDLPRPRARAAAAPPLLGVAVAVFASAGAVAGYAFHRLLTSNTPLGVPVTGQPRVRDWIDRVVPAGNPVALLAYPVSRDWGQSAIPWWDAEFWNNRVTAGVRRPGRDVHVHAVPEHGPAPRLRDRRFDGTDDAPPFVLAAPNDSRFGLAGAQAAANVGLVLRQVERPYRALWATRGLEQRRLDAARPAGDVRVYAGPAGRTRSASR